MGGSDRRHWPAKNASTRQLLWAVRYRWRIWWWYRHPGEISTERVRWVLPRLSKRGNVKHAEGEAGWPLGARDLCWPDLDEPIIVLGRVGERNRSDVGAPYDRLADKPEESDDGRRDVE